jgi:ribose transport system permease protein
MIEVMPKDVEQSANIEQNGRRAADAPDGGQRVLAFASRYGTIVFLAVLIVLFAVLSEIILGQQRFLTGANLSLILRQSAVLAILAGGLTVVLILGEFDLSIAASLTLGGAMFAQFVQGEYVLTWPRLPFTDVGGGAIFGVGWQSSVGFALVAALVFGVVLGLVNGVIVSYFGVTAFIATLGVAGIVEGYLIRISGGRSVQLPENVTDTAQGTLFGWSAPTGWRWEFSLFGGDFDFNLSGLSVPVISLAAAVVLAALWTFLNHTEAGRRMDAVGGNPEASRLAGINVRRYRLTAFVLCAAVGSFAGIVLASGRTGSAVTLVGNQGSYLLQAFTACFLGAVTLKEGEFHIVGTVVGVTLMTVTFSGLIILGVPGYAQTIANGAILVAALTFAGLARKAAGRSDRGRRNRFGRRARRDARGRQLSATGLVAIDSTTNKGEMQ